MVQRMKVKHSPLQTSILGLHRHQHHVHHRHVEKSLLLHMQQCHNHHFSTSNHTLDHSLLQAEEDLAGHEKKALS